MPVSSLLQSEWQDLEARLASRKWSREEFDIAEQDRLGGTEISVQHRHSGAKRLYTRAAGGSWVADFVRDLDAGFF